MKLNIFFNPTYAIGGAKSSELLVLVGLTPIYLPAVKCFIEGRRGESLFQCCEANCKSLIIFVEYVISRAYCIFWVLS